jgi:hypothetical protein
MHIVLANDYSFTMWSRPFKLVSEVYHKEMTDVRHTQLIMFELDTQLQIRQKLMRKELI